MNTITFLQRYLVGPGIGAQFIKALAGSAGLRVMGMALTFLVGIQLARGLGVEGYGIYGVAMSAISLLAIPAEFGFPQLLVREVASNHVTGNWGRLKGVMHWASRATMLISVVIVVLVIGWIFFAGNQIQQPLISTLLAGLVMVPMGVLGRQTGAVLLGLHHPIKGQLPDIVVRPLIFSISLLAASMLSFNVSASTAMILGAISAIVAFLMAKLMLESVLPSDVRKAEIVLDSKSWWKSAAPMAVTEGIRGLQGNIAILVISSLATASSAGIFRVASSVSMVATMPITLFLVIGSPLMSRLYTQGDMARLQRLLSWIALGMTLCSVLLTLPFLIAGPALLSFVFSPEFGSANTPLLIMCIGGILFSCFGASVVLLNMCGHEKHVTYAFGYSVLLLLVTIVPMVNLFNENGAAYASSVSLLLGNVLMWNYAKNLIGIDTSIFSLLKKGV